MSSIIDRILGSRPAPVAADDLQKRLDAANQRVRELEADYATAALEWASGEPKAGAQRDRAAEALTVAKRDRDALAAALRLAREAAASEDRARLAALHAGQIHGMTMRLRRAERAAEELADALEKVGDARRKLLAASADARTSAPSPLPLGSLTERAILERLISQEMHRLTYDQKLGALPGSRPADLMTKDNVAAMVPLADQLRMAHDRAIAVVKGEAADPGIVHAPQVPVADPALEAEELAGERIAGGAVLPRVDEAPEYDADALQPGTHDAAEIMATVPRVKMG
jgi:hypothetical protein